MTLSLAPASCICVYAFVLNEPLMNLSFIHSNRNLHSKQTLLTNFSDERWLEVETIEGKLLYLLNSLTENSILALARECVHICH